MFLGLSVSSSVPRKVATVGRLLVDGEENMVLDCTLHHLEVTRRSCRCCSTKKLISTLKVECMATLYRQGIFTYIDRPITTNGLSYARLRFPIALLETMRLFEGIDSGYGVTRR